MALPAQNFPSYLIMHCDIYILLQNEMHRKEGIERQPSKDVGCLNCIEETVFQPFFARRNKR